MRPLASSVFLFFLSCPIFHHPPPLAFLPGYSSIKFFNAHPTRPFSTTAHFFIFLSDTHRRSCHCPPNQTVFLKFTLLASLCRYSCHIPRAFATLLSRPRWRQIMPSPPRLSAIAWLSLPSTPQPSYPGQNSSPFSTHPLEPSQPSNELLFSEETLTIPLNHIPRCNFFIQHHLLTIQRPFFFASQSTSSIKHPHTQTPPLHPSKKINRPLHCCPSLSLKYPKKQSSTPKSSYPLVLLPPPSFSCRPTSKIPIFFPAPQNSLFKRDIFLLIIFLPYNVDCPSYSPLFFI